MRRPDGSDAGGYRYAGFGGELANNVAPAIDQIDSTGKSEQDVKNDLDRIRTIDDVLDDAIDDVIQPTGGGAKGR